MAQAATQMRNEAQAQNPRAEFHGTFCWNELMTLDEKAAQQFYANTIGWSFDPMPMDWGT
jgi:predicted enzyme related to lactoylglutathione lyase